MTETISPPDTFSDIEYTRPDPDAIKEEFQALLDQLREAGTRDKQISAIQEINDLRDRISTLATIAQIRHSLDTRVEKWEEENQFFDRFQPEIQHLSNKYYKILSDAVPDELIQEAWGDHLLNLAKVKARSFSTDVVEAKQEENELTTQYQKLLASAEIEFDGETRNLSEMIPFQEDPDREVRKRATEAKWDFFGENQEELDEIYDRLVHHRDDMAETLGYDNFVRLGYDWMGRTDYGPDEVEQLRSVIAEQIVPVVEELKDQQRQRLGVEHLTIYDEPCQFPSGNPKPQGDRDWIVDRASEMYADLSERTDTFFQMMNDRELMDLETRSGKAGGGYCTFLPDEGAPFIFANFNGTKGDVKVLTHEVGHAFQKYCSRHYNLPEYRSPTAEAAEIHSMGMEYLTWPYMESFFGEDDVEKFLFGHITSSLELITYGSAVDEFQHRVYREPDLTPEQRREIWSELEETYLPFRNNDGIEPLEEGGYWQRQQHVYRFPFYYIDYVLAKICALQIWSRSRQDREETWSDYLRLCELGGSKPFRELVREGNLDSPFREDWVETVLPEIQAFLRG